jgi:hypothetical protein
MVGVSAKVEGGEGLGAVERLPVSWWYLDDGFVQLAPLQPFEEIAHLLGVWCSQIAGAHAGDEVVEAPPR